LGGSACELSGLFCAIAIGLQALAGEDVLRVAGLPVVEKVLDRDRRLVEVRADGKPLLAYHRDLAGQLTGVTVAGVAELSVSPEREVTLRSGGRILHAAKVASAYGNRAPETLRLNLLHDARIAEPKQWQTNADGTEHLVTGRNGKPLYRATVDGPDRVVYAPDGRALLYDLDLLGLVDQGPPSGPFFSRLVITKNGGVEVLAPFAPAGAVLALRVVEGKVEFDLSPNQPFR
jgi:hypothetical protein